MKHFACLHQQAVYHCSILQLHVLLLLVMSCFKHVLVLNVGTKKVQEAVKGGEGGGRYFPINAVQVTLSEAVLLQIHCVAMAPIKLRPC